MKKSVLSLLFISGLLMTSLNINAQIVVKVRPEEPVVHVERPPAPSPAHVWIDGEWRWEKRSHNYVWKEGYWARPHAGMSWERGRWEDVQGGSRVGARALGEEIIMKSITRQVAKLLGFFHL